MAQLQRPELAYMNGSLVQWDKAVLHVGCEAVTRGLNLAGGGLFALLAARLALAERS